MIYYILRHQCGWHSIYGSAQGVDPLRNKPAWTIVMAYTTYKKALEKGKKLNDEVEKDFN